MFKEKKTFLFKWATYLGNFLLDMFRQLCKKNQHSKIGSIIKYKKSFTETYFIITLYL